MPQTILIAEDNLANQEFLTELLSSFGYEVRVASNGRKTLEDVERAAPDLILLDVDMPVLNGYEVVKILRGKPEYALLPVVAVTGYAMEGDREKALAGGFDGYVSKPIDAQILLRTMQSLLARSSPEAREVKSR